MLPAILAATLLHAGPAPVPVADAPAAWAPAITRAQESAQAFQKALQGRLREAMTQGGPPAAIDACSRDAARIAAEVATSSGVKLGRTSDRLRNASNTPPAWAVEPLHAAAGKKGAEVKPVAVDLGSQVGVLLPITVAQACTGCHGAADTMSPPVKAALAARYPADRATGYAEGDFRGFVWVEAAK